MQRVHDRRPLGVTAEPAGGVAPLSVQFAGPEGLRCEWDFGDGVRASGQRVAHVYEDPGLYLASLTVTDNAGASSATQIRVGVDSASTGPLVRVACAQGETHSLTLHGDLVGEQTGALRFAEAQPWSWAAVGDGRLADLEGLRSFTVLGWARPTSRETGSGGNRIACNLNFDRAELDLVTLPDGRLRLAVNEWPDRAPNDSSGALRLNAWTFFAVTYDATSANECVHWYFGDAERPAELGAVTNDNRGATGVGSGPLTIGNYGPSLHQLGLDRQFRGTLADVAIYGSRASARGALALDAIRRWQAATRPERDRMHLQGRARRAGPTCAGAARQRARRRATLMRSISDGRCAG
jgi:PKD repeat protein